MFSDHFKKVDDAPAKTLFVIAACLVIACQLVALVMVADGQVRKAELRDARYASQRFAAGQCVESNVGLARQSCLQQVYDGGESPIGAATSQQAIADVSELPDRASTSTRLPGMMSISFAGAAH